MTQYPSKGYSGDDFQTNKNRPSRFIDRKIPIFAVGSPKKKKALSHISSEIPQFRISATKSISFAQYLTKKFPEGSKTICLITDFYMWIIFYDI